VVEIGIPVIDVTKLNMRYYRLWIIVMSVIVIVYGFHDRSAHGSATGSQQPSEWPAGSKLFDYLSRCELVSSRSSRTVFIQVIRGRRPRNLFHSSSGDAAKIFMPSALSSIPAINVKKTFMEV